MTVALSNTPVLETERLILRAPRGGDWTTFADYAASDRAHHTGGPLKRSQAWRSWGHVIGHWVMRGFGLFVFTLKDNDAPLGIVGPWRPEGWPERELGWTVWSADHEGKGLAFEAAARGRDYAFNDLGWDTAVSYIDAPNTRSIALAERLGAVHDPDAAVMELDDDGPNVMVFRHSPPTDSLPTQNRSDTDTDLGGQND
jgi:RimJ/RimL family protein N-acetyltransferase